MNPDEIMFMVNPLIKGEIEPFSGNFLFGRMWEKRDLEYVQNEFKKSGVRYIWNLQDTSHGPIGDAEEIWTPIPDQSIPANLAAFNKDVDKVASLLIDKQKVFVHCFSGKGRTSLAVAVVLTRFNIPTLEALRYVKKVIRGPETLEQVYFIIENY